MADDHAMLLTGDALRLGATGVVLKSSAFQELKQAIHEVLRGRSYITPIVTRDVVGALIEDKTSRHELTMCQREVLQLLAEGAREGDRCHP
jgi:DNA-binding NarL/FixJ family response regulator